MAINTLGYALLALIAREPRSGYDLAQAMSKPIGFFWHARHSQIYPELARLEGQGLVTYERIEQQDRPDKKLYTITEQGLVALREWITEPAEEVPERNVLLLKTYTIWLADPEKAIKLFHVQEDQHRTQLALYEGILAELEQEYGSDWRFDTPFFGDYATLRKGIGYERKYVEWCHWMVEQLEQDLKSRSQDGQ